MPGAPDAKVGGAGTGKGLLVIGTNHRTSPPPLRERFALVEADLAAALAELRRRGLGEAALIATCDRIDLVTAADTPGAAEAWLAVVAAQTGLPARSLTDVFYRHEGEAALRHLFAVASSLDSLVIGEPQVLGQVKAAHRAAAEAGLVGPTLEAAFAGAYAAARRIRRDTVIAQRPVSLATAALQFARDIHGDLGRCAALLLGPGEMGELIAEQFRRAGLGHLVVCGPPGRADRAAQHFACNMAPLADLDVALVAADVVIASLGSGRAVLTVARITEALRRRPRRPIFIIDAAIPPDAEPAVNAIDGAFLYDLNDLERAAMEGRANREAASVDAWRIVDAELADFAARRLERQAVPAIVALRHHVEMLRDEVLREAGSDAETATRLLVNRLLHDPSEELRALAARRPEDAATMEILLRRLFRLGGDEEIGQ